jgi:hypothetical protein
VFLIPFFEISIVSFFALSEKIFQKKYFSKILIIVLICLILINSSVTGREIAKEKETKGTYNFSPAIFELNDYIHDESIQSRDIVFLEWGMYAQLYFLNKGEFKINSLVFQLYDTKSYRERRSIFKNYFVNQRDILRSDTLYFPVYSEGVNSRNDAILTDFKRFVVENNGTVTRIKTFYETNGDKVIYVYRLDNATRFFDTVEQASLSLEEISNDFAESKSSYGIVPYSGWYGDNWIGKRGYAIINAQYESDVSFKGYVPEFIPSNYVVVRLNDAVVFAGNVTGGTSVSFDGTAQKGINVVNVTCEKEVIPSSLGINPDVRPLAFRLSINLI